ncbi:MAG TPA: hypothetical protein V6C84_01435 [Coleofasciculaceae cyanobacterium]
MTRMTRQLMGQAMQPCKTNQTLQVAGQTFLVISSLQSSLYRIWITPVLDCVNECNGNGRQTSKVG